MSPKSNLKFFFGGGVGIYSLVVKTFKVSVKN